MEFFNRKEDIFVGYEKGGWNEKPDIEENNKKSVENVERRNEIIGAEGIDYVKPKIVVVGVGGAGCNSVRRLAQMGISSACKLIAINTDVRQLDDIKDERIIRVLIGGRTTFGQGAGGNPEVGEEAAIESTNIIANVLAGANIVFLSVGEGGGTGTGAAPVIAKIAKDIGAIVICFATYPFKLERIRMNHADIGLMKLKKYSDTVIVIDNNKLLEYAPNLPIDKAFEQVDMIIGKAITGITNSILEPSLINLDFADFKAIMENGKIAMISVGSGSGPKRIEEAVNRVMNQPLLDIDWSGGEGALIHVTGGQSLSLNEANSAGRMLTEQMHNNANVIWGARIDPSYGDKVDVILIMTGVKSKLLNEIEQRLARRIKESSVTLEEEKKEIKEQVQRQFEYKKEGWDVYTKLSTEKVVEPEKEEKLTQGQYEQSLEKEIKEIKEKEQVKKSDIIGDVEASPVKICVIGVGGGGGNTITRLSTEGVEGAKLIAANTDRNALLNMVKEGKTPITKILLGGRVTKGMGAGGYPEVGEKAAEESMNYILDAIGDSQLTFIAAGMGGGTGTGAAPLIAKAAKEKGSLVIAFVTFPFRLEKARVPKAREGIEKLRRYCDTVVVIDNDELLKLYPNIPMEQAFMEADKIIMQTIKGITETISTPSLMNLDFADIKAVMGNGDISLICVGEGSGPDRVKTAVEQALTHPLLQVEYKDESGALIHITGGKDLSLNEATKIVEEMSKGVKKSAKVIWGARIDPNMGDRIRVVAILTGVKSKNILSSAGPSEYTLSYDRSVIPWL